MGKKHTIASISNKDNTKHVTSGIRKIFEKPSAYDLWLKITGTRTWVKKVVDEYITPFKNAKILDIGCGTGLPFEFMDSRLNIDYVGFDINPAYIEFSKIKFKNRGRFYCSSVNDFSPDNYRDNFDIAISLGVIHHLDEAESKKLISLAKSSLKKTGYLILAEPVIHDDQSKVEKYLMSKDRGQNIRNKDGYLELLKDDFIKIEANIRTDLMTIPWSICIMKCYM